MMPALLEEIANYIDIKRMFLTVLKSGNKIVLF